MVNFLILILRTYIFQVHIPCKMDHQHDMGHMGHHEAHDHMMGMNGSHNAEEIMSVSFLFLSMFFTFVHVTRSMVLRGY